MFDNVAIISTSINARPKDYAAWAKQGVLIVAGDLNSPPELRQYVEEIGGVYLGVEDQERYPFSDALGWCCIQRRNVAVMYAYENTTYDFILTVDDDNTPATDDFVEVHAGYVSGELEAKDSVVIAKNRWINTGDFLEPPTWQRGTPYGFNTQLSDVEMIPWEVDVVVSQAQAVGAPDCDAVTRITIDPDVIGIKRSAIIGSGSRCIFNSQATMWRREWAPLLACLPYVGRYDDVIASVIAQAVMQTRNAFVRVGGPAAVQVRNDHDLTKDLKGERWGMMHLPLIDAELERAVSTTPAEMFMAEELYDTYERFTRHLAGKELLPDETLRFMNAWAWTWRQAAKSQLE
jgi:hypothetical protein